MSKVLTAVGATAMIVGFDAAFKTINEHFDRSMLSVRIDSDRRFWTLAEIVKNMQRNGWTIQGSAWRVINRERPSDGK